MKHFGLLAVVVGMLLVGPGAAWAVSFGQIDDFQNGTTHSWGGGSAPTNIATGGPAGAGDRFLQITGSGFQPLGMSNAAQWTGDYLAADVTAITADVANFGNSAVELRVVLIFGAGGDFTSTLTTVVPANGAWYPVTFGLTAADLTHVGGGTGVLNDSLAGIGTLVIRHQPGAPAGPGGAPPSSEVIGLDNITAVPEPATLALLTLATVGLLRRRPR